MLRFILPIFLAVATASVAADGPVITKPSPDAGRRLVPEVSLRPPRPIDVLHYDLSLVVNADNARLSGDVLIRLLPRQDLDRIVLDFTTASTAPGAGMIATATKVFEQARDSGPGMPPPS